ncbi:MAG: 1-acyl-sn-glycerol-3-phosphate acyltransferase, partial [Myxococcota bacterium]
DNIPEGGCLLVVNHSLATYDIAMLSHAVFDKLGRMPRGLGDKRVFQVPGLASLARYFGAVVASHEQADRLLSDGLIVLVAPGGMKEALRPSEERYEVRWEERRGFVRLAIRTGVPIVLAACPAADDLFDVAPSSLTDRLYRDYHVPLPMLRGLKSLASLVPKAVALTHVIGEPIAPPKLGEECSDADTEAAVVALHDEVLERMSTLMTRGLELADDAASR